MKVLISIFIGLLILVPSTALANENTVLFIESDTSNGSTEIVDSSQFQHVFEHLNGAVYHSTDQAAVGTSSILFNGNTNLLTPYTPDLELPGDFTIDCWLFWGRFRTGNYQFIAGNYGGGGWLLGLNDGTRKIAFWSAAHGSTYKFSETVIELNKWYHIAIVRAGTVFSMWIDGVMENEWEGAGPLGTSVVGLYLAGLSGGDARRFVGFMDNFRISNVALSDFSAPDTGAETVPLSLSFSASTIEGEAPLAVGFAIQGEGGVGEYVYSIDFGTGTTSSEGPTIPTEFTFQEPGVYTVIAAVLDALGVRVEKIIEITVTEPEPETCHVTFDFIENRLVIPCLEYQGGFTKRS